MAVQKSKKSRSRSGMRRSHDRAILPALSVEKASGEMHIRHHMTESGYYRGKRIIDKSVAEETESGQEEAATATSESSAAEPEKTK